MSYEYEQSMRRKAKVLYEQYTNNHPSMHCNRFPSWEELSDETRDEYVNRAKRDI